MPLTDQPEHDGDLLTTYVPNIAGGFLETDHPHRPAPIALQRVIEKWVVKFCPLEDSRHLPESPWVLKVDKPEGQVVYRQVHGLFDPVHWGFRTNVPGAEFHGR